MNTALLLLFSSFLLMLGWVLGSVMHQTQRLEQAHKLKRRQLNIRMERARTLLQLDRDLDMMGRGYCVALDYLERAILDSECSGSESIDVLSTIASMRSDLPDIKEQTRRDLGVSPF
jgi:type II secretory pathway component PulJ